MRKITEGDTTMEGRLKHHLQMFANEKGNSVSVSTDNMNVAKCISFQTSHMRRMFATFPEVLLIDATHNTNNLN
ncbi:TPA: hypothetical protein N0F65_003016 [Lagenidium giganteum]|uniref:ZSWIM1/3 RNaseH-like domain-containing protein n=1 Tax=Lagenidium giganteum TaxID=4803 RepID=A0AAV2YTV9_9STRA|nr:TPA: hypothetical protein N0F65_003016 [Lagenidium giganteum]